MVRGGKKKGGEQNQPEDSAPFQRPCWVREDHKDSLFGVSFNPYTKPDDPPVFATVGSNRVTIYECPARGGSTAGTWINLVQSYADPSADEIFYTVCWVYREGEEQVEKEEEGQRNKGNFDVLLAVGGQRGLVRIISTRAMKDVFTLMGHGDAVNEVRGHPLDSNLLLSASKDNSLRLWNLRTQRCVLVLGGLEGHRDEVLSCDFDLKARFVMSCSMDHSVKLWSLETEEVRSTIEHSYTYTGVEKPFPVLHVHFPIFSTRTIHRNYVDCVRWFGNFVLSKSCENKIVCWKANLKATKSSSIPSTVEVIHSFDYQDCDIWYMRFGVDYSFKWLAAGNQVGKIFLWQIDSEPSQPFVLSHGKCSRAIRQVAFSPDSKILVAVSDDATVLRWDLA